MVGAEEQRQPQRRRAHFGVHHRIPLSESVGMRSVWQLTGRGDVIGDLHAVRGCGVRTGFICRPNEYDDSTTAVSDKAKAGEFDVIC